MTIKINGFEIEATVSEAIEFVKAFGQEKQKEAQEPKPAPKKKELDIGKMKALRAAGWTLAAIADELGTTSGTVSKKLTKEGVK